MNSLRVVLLSLLSLSSLSLTVYGLGRVGDSLEHLSQWIACQ